MNLFKKGNLFRCFGLITASSATNITNGVALYGRANSKPSATEPPTEPHTYT